jgi:hypothetical protein
MKQSFTCEDHVYQKPLSSSRIALVLVSLLFANPVFSQNLFSSRLKLYECLSKEDAISCQRCKVPDFGSGVASVDFKIDVSNSRVISQVYFGSALAMSRVEKQCTVIDRKNWSCGEDGKYDESMNYSFNKVGMNNGIYFEFRELRFPSRPRLNLQGFDSKSYYCAK